MQNQFVDVAWQVSCTHQHICCTPTQELLDRVLWAGFQFSCSGQVGDQGEGTTNVASGTPTHLPHRLDVGKINVAHRA